MFAKRSNTALAGASIGGTAAQIASAAALTASLLSASEGFAAEPPPIFGERTPVNHVTTTNAFDNVGVMLNYQDPEPKYCAIGWTRVDLQPGEKVGHFCMVFAHEDAGGAPNEGPITNMNWKVLVANSTNELGLDALQRNVVAVLPHPDNENYATNVIGTFLNWYDLKFATFDLRSLNITNATYIAVVPESRSGVWDISTLIGFSAGGLGTTGTNSNFYTPAPGINLDPPSFLNTLHYFSDYLATAVTTVETSFRLSMRKDGPEIVLEWNRAGDKELQLRPDLNTRWQKVAGSRQTNSMRFPITGAPSAFYNLEQSPDPELDPAKKK